MSRQEQNLTPAEAAVNQWDEEWRAKRKKSVAEASERFTTDELIAIKKLPKADKQDLAADLMMAGVNRSATEDILGERHGTIAKWIFNETATMQQKIHDGMSRKALIEFPETFSRLADLRHHPNAETSRKACLDMARAAGRGIDAPAPASLTVNMNGKNNQFNLTTRELEEQISKIAESLGPDAVTLARGELGIKPAGFTNEPGRPNPGSGDPFEAPPGTPPPRQRKPD